MGNGVNKEIANLEGVTSLILYALSLILTIIADVTLVMPKFAVRRMEELNPGQAAKIIDDIMPPYAANSKETTPAKAGAKPDTRRCL